MWNVLVTNNTTVTMGKYSILCKWSPAITRTDGTIIISLAYMILCNNILTFEILVNYIFNF